MATIPQAHHVSNTVSYYATLGAREGVALRLPDNSCWFVAADDETDITLLSNADIGGLMLFGRCDVVEEALVADYDAYAASGDDGVILAWLAQHRQSTLAA